ncbi:asparagine synthase (glutamine-hydrolyzing) [Elioraea thermophila]|uniref:asparagine synthase (glutamine-hydrolyzing) n=1 Tax=Elioraea thermophila TaxID=2185104 RepID=UPI000DF49038|nr:asparagine synthase (glutamine-hydrolyzing) [Elioraea thermophila]
MCGIAGLARLPGKSLPPDLAGRLDEALAHRGPDGAGRHQAGSVLLVHRRLAIIDLAGGAQPLHAPDGTALIANGEIYSYRELRSDLLADVRFATDSDCEVPLHLFVREGEGFAARLRGMWAIAIHEPRSDRLVLSRDPFGIKPLYLAETPLGLAFASEPRALVAAGLIAPEIEPRARDELLELQFTTGRGTIWRGIERVLPGETLTIAAGRVIARRRCHALPAGGPEEIGEEEALARLDRALEESVALHQRSDVPYGLFLSGGTDSAAVLALMRRLAERPVLAFTAGFDDPSAADERAAARAAARAAGAAHEEITVTEADFLRHLPAIVAAMDDPAADYAIVPTWLLARRARAEVTVVLSGEGGDELFAGYGRYRAAMRPWWLGGRAMHSRGILERLGLRRSPARSWRSGLEAAIGGAATPGRTCLMAAQAADIAEWLPNDLLAKLDRCLMAHGVEGRTPFLDPAVVAAAFRLPDRLKVRGRTGKWILRAWLERHFPDARPFAPKQGFTVPVAAWIARSGDRLGALVAADPAVAELCEPDRVRALFRAEGKHAGFAAWTLLFYALWHRVHIRGIGSGGDVFDVLAATG